MRPSGERRAAWVPPRRPIGSRVRVGRLIGHRVRRRQPVTSCRRLGGAQPTAGLCRAGMAAARHCADGLCCTHSGVRQTLDEMDFEKGEAGAEPEVAPGGRGLAAPGRKEVVGSWHGLGHWKHGPARRERSWAARVSERGAWGCAPMLGMELLGRRQHCAGN